MRAKLRDIVALGVLATLVLACFGLSLLTQVAIQAGVHATDALGLANAGDAVRVIVELLASGVATFAALLVVYGLAAPGAAGRSRRCGRARSRPRWRSTPASRCYAFYLVQLASFSTIYGPLGAVFAFLALLYVASALVLFGRS